MAMAGTNGISFCVGDGSDLATQRKVLIDSAGNVCVGTTTALVSSAGRGNVTINGSTDAVLAFGNGGTNSAYIFNNSGQLEINAIGSRTINFTNNGSERMRINSSGQWMLGTTSALNSGGAIGSIAFSNGQGLFIATNGQGNGQVMGFNYNLTTNVGSINITGSATSYATSSDYRLKENIAPMTGALATVAKLNPVTYNWKVDGSSGQGFIAHELQEVVPDCVTGEKDAVDKDGKPQYQGIDTSFLVATLTKAIQEQQTLITNLTTRLTALENK
jgi:hypothetical protein